MDITFIRNATLWINYGGLTLLIDPMLGPAGSQKPFPNSPRQDLRNPLEDLPVPPERLLDPDLVVVTHLHRDHFDRAATEMLPKDLPVLVQNQADQAKLESRGFENVSRIGEWKWEKGEVRMFQVCAQHSHGAMYEMSGPACGLVLTHPEEKTLYVTGDTVWCDPVKEALKEYKPEVIVLSCGENMVYGYDPLIMGACDVLNVHQVLPESTLIGCHMESLNHWMLSKEALRTFAGQHGFRDRLILPERGECIKV